MALKKQKRSSVDYNQRANAALNRKLNSSFGWCCVVASAIVDWVCGSAVTQTAPGSLLSILFLRQGLQGPLNPSIFEETSTRMQEGRSIGAKTSLKSLADPHKQMAPDRSLSFGFFVRRRLLYTFV
jgi:hypothetical protein